MLVSLLYYLLTSNVVILSPDIFTCQRIWKLFFTLSDLGFLVNICCFFRYVFANSTFALISSIKLNKSLESFFREFNSDFEILLCSSLWPEFSSLKVVKFSNLDTFYWIFCFACAFLCLFGRFWYS